MKAMQFLKSHKGQGMVEYALITLAIVTIVVFVAFNQGTFKAAIEGVFAKATAQISSVT